MLNCVKVVNDAYKVATAEGRKSGLAEGIIKGRKSGIVEGKSETAKRLLKLGIDIETIVKATELSREEIEKLQNA